MIRSMSRWKQVRTSHSGSGLGLPVLSLASTPRGADEQLFCALSLSLADIPSFPPPFPQRYILHILQNPSIFRKNFLRPENAAPQRGFRASAVTSPSLSQKAGGL